MIPPPPPDRSATVVVTSASLKELSTVLVRFFGFPYNDLVICKDSPDYLV